MKKGIHKTKALQTNKDDKNEGLLDVKVDYVFAKLFGKKNHERVLVCLLNAILNGKPHIKSKPVAKRNLG